ncbi:uncharacterized protein LOC129739247 isoform X2 [Uranotaenia lowii]|uniref:uncharacterized protein LOC129739247 isoform X2 n=1 Tax=Uranotaenia lowii TaxID=190385 RepID=UPI002478CA51|nr:uncharacterized protein LOC129739247 isoform X2 [Uranotaenia lowii]
MMIANRFILIGSVLCAGILLLCDAQSSTNRRFQNPSSEILVYDAERASWISVETNHSPTSQVAAQGVRPSSVVGPNISGNSQGSDRRNNPNEGFQNPSSEILVYDAERASWITVETNRSTTSQVAAQGVRPSSVVGPNKSGNSQGSNRWNNPNEGQPSTIDADPSMPIQSYDTETRTRVDTRVAESEDQEYIKESGVMPISRPEPARTQRPFISWAWVPVQSNPQRIDPSTPAPVSYYDTNQKPKAQKNKCYYDWFLGEIFCYRESDPYMIFW